MLLSLELLGRTLLFRYASDCNFNLQVVGSYRNMYFLHQYESFLHPLWLLKKIKERILRQKTSLLYIFAGGHDAYPGMIHVSESKNVAELIPQKGHCSGETRKLQNL